MKLAHAIALREIRAAEPPDFEYHVGLQPIGRFHPPSLKKPFRVKQDLPTDGWHKGDSKAARRKALQDMAVIHKRLRRQTGKREIAHTALMPVFPDISKWF